MYYYDNFIVESDSFHAMSWISNREAYLWKFQFLFNEIRLLSTIISFQYKNRSTNMMTDALVKQGVERTFP